MRPLDAIEKEFLKKRVPKFDVGDTVDVHVKILEGDRERVQIFTGVVIAKRHEGLGETFTVRRMVQGEGVERIFPVHTPRVVNIDVKKKGKVRRAKLHYLRDRVGRATRVEEKVGAPTGGETVPKAPVAPLNAEAPVEKKEEPAKKS